MCLGVYDSVCVCLCFERDRVGEVIAKGCCPLLKQGWPVLNIFDLCWTDSAPASNADQSDGCEPPAPPPEVVPEVQQDAEMGETAANSSKEKTTDDEDEKAKEDGKEDSEQKEWNRFKRRKKIF